MRSRAIFTAALVAILASLAFGQADSCNMTLVDEWTYVSSENAAGIDMIGNHLLLALRGHVFSFELSAAGELTLLDSLVFPIPDFPPTFSQIVDIAHIDSFIYIQTANYYSVYEETNLLIYKIDNSGRLDSITDYSLDSCTGSIQISDTLCYLYGAGYGFYYILNISNAISPSFITHGTFDGPESPTAFWGEYPYLYNGGYTYIDATPHAWESGYFNIMDVSDTDSQFISYSACSEFGTFYYPSEFFCMTMKDSLLYIGGYNRYLEAYDIETDGTGANFVCSYGDSTFYDYAVCICRDGIICSQAALL